MNKQAVAQELVKVAKLLSADNWEDKPKFGDDQKFEGSPVRRRDRVMIVLAGDARVPGEVVSYGVSLHNPNRGSSYFAIGEEEDFDKLERSFSSALAGARRAFIEHRKKVNDWYHEQQRLEDEKEKEERKQKVQEGEEGHW